MGAASRGHVEFLDSYISENGKLTKGFGEDGDGYKFGESEKVKESLLVEKIVNELRNAAPSAAIRTAQWLLSRKLITFVPEKGNDSDKEKNSENESSDEEVRALLVVPESLKFLNARYYFEFLLFVQSTGYQADWEKALPCLVDMRGLTMAAIDYLDNRLHLMDSDTSQNWLLLQIATCASGGDFSLLKAILKRFPAMSSFPNIAKAIYNSLVGGIDDREFSIYIHYLMVDPSCSYWDAPVERSVYERLPSDGSLQDLVLFLDNLNLSPPNKLAFPLAVRNDISHCRKKYKSILTHTWFDFVQLLLDRGVHLSIVLMNAVMDFAPDGDCLKAFVERNYEKAQSGSDWFFAAILNRPTQSRTLIGSVLYPKYWQDGFHEKIIKKCFEAKVQQRTLEDIFEWMQETLPALDFEFTNSLLSYIMNYDVQWFLSMFGVNSEVLLRLHELFSVEPEELGGYTRYFHKLKELLEGLAAKGVGFPGKVIDNFLENVRRYIRDRSWEADTSRVWETIALLRAHGAPNWTEDTFCILIENYSFCAPLINGGGGGGESRGLDGRVSVAQPSLLWMNFVREKCPFGAKAARKVEEMKGEEERKNAKHYLTQMGLYSFT